jgi:UDP-glucuronate 4-epimerase
VVNLAAQAGVRYSIENPYAYMNSNLVGFLNIIELCRHHDVEGLIYASSSSVYGGNKKIPFSVEDRVDNPISFYAVSKKSNELIANSYSHLYGLHTTGLRYFTVYGPWGRPDMAMLIFTRKILAGEPIPVFNNGNMKRDFTYIADIIAGTRAAINKNFKCEVFNLGNNKSEQLMDVVSLIEQNLNQKAEINYLPMQPGDVPESYADINKSIDMLNYKPVTNVDQGIKKLIDWYQYYYK